MFAQLGNKIDSAGRKLDAGYKAQVHNARGLFAFLLASVAEVAAAGPDTVVTWSKRQWVAHGAFAVGAGLIARMRAGDFTPPPAPPPAPPTQG